MRAREIFEGSDSALTRAYNTDLKRAGHKGHLAVALLRAQKASYRAKRYRGGPQPGVRYSDMAYANKSKAIGEVCAVLNLRSLVPWGWKIDPRESFARWVLYIDLPDIGQVSFHNIKRLGGPDYPGDWDGAHASVERICAFCDSVMDSLVCSPASLF